MKGFRPGGRRKSGAERAEIGGNLPRGHPCHAFQRPKKPGKTGRYAEEIGCEIGKLSDRENRRRKPDAKRDVNVMEEGRLRNIVWVIIDYLSDSLAERTGSRTNASFRYPEQEFFPCRQVRALASASRTLTVWSW